MSSVIQGKLRTKKVTVLSEDDVAENNGQMFVDSNNIRFVVGSNDVFNVGKEDIEDFFVARTFTWYSFQATTGLDDEWFAGGLQIQDANGNDLVDQQAVVWTKDQQIAYGTTLYDRLVFGSGGIAEALTDGGAYVQPLYVGIPYGPVASKHRFRYLATANYAAQTPDLATIAYSTSGDSSSDPRSLVFTTIDTYNPEAAADGFHDWPAYP